MSSFVDDVWDVVTDPLNLINPGAGVTKKGAEKAVEAIVPVPEMPEAPQTPQTPTRSDDRVQAAADTERRRAAMAGGRASTILTGGRGLMEPAPVARRTLLG